MAVADLDIRIKGVFIQGITVLCSEPIMGYNIEKRATELLGHPLSIRRRGIDWRSASKEDGMFLHEYLAGLERFFGILCVVY